MKAGYHSEEQCVDTDEGHKKCYFQLRNKLFKHGDS